MLNRGGARRFAMVCPNYYPLTCGVGDYTMRLGRELNRRGMDVALFTHAPAESHPESPSIPVTGAEGASPLVRARVLREAIRTFDPTDLVIQYTARMLEASRFGSPAMPWLLNQMPHGVHKTVIFHELYFPWSWRPDLAVADVLQRIQFCWTVAASDRVFVTTLSRRKSTEHLLRQAGRASDVGTLFVGANADPVQKPPGPRGSDRRLGVFSLLRPTRRFDLLIEAFATINAQHPDTELVFIGDLGTTADPLFRRLMNQIVESPVRTRIRLTGPISLADVAQEVASLDVYMLPDHAGASTRSSTLPIAFGSGIPVVATEGPETDRDLFLSEENIVYSEGMSAPALARAAMRLLNDHELAARIGAGGRALYAKSLSWASIADEFLRSGQEERH